MLIFGLCLLGAGAVLSLLTRVHGLLTIALGVCVASAAVALYRSFEAGPGYHLGLTLILAIVALQVGYGLGIVARAALSARLRRPSGSAPASSGHTPVQEAKQPLSRES